MLNLYAEALSTFSLLFEEAKSSSEIEPDAMMLATASLEGHPSVRTVLLKKFDARGFVFYSHLDSPKGRDLQANPQAALLFLWRSLREAGVQVRIEEGAAGPCRGGGCLFRFASASESNWCMGFDAVVSLGVA